jgi:hypothetical protein
VAGFPVGELRQRSTDGLLDRSIAFFVDANLAEHAKEFAYKEYWGIFAQDDFTPDEWFDGATRAIALAEGFDSWSTTNSTSISPIFYVVKHQVLSSVPSTIFPLLTPSFGIAEIW